MTVEAAHRFATAAGRNAKRAGELADKIERTVDPDEIRDLADELIATAHRVRRSGVQVRLAVEDGNGDAESNAS